MVGMSSAKAKCFPIVLAVNAAGVSKVLIVMEIHPPIDRLPLDAREEKDPWRTECAAGVFSDRSRFRQAQLARADTIAHYFGDPPGPLLVITLSCTILSIKSLDFRLVGSQGVT